MTSNNIYTYTSYFYIIEHIPTGMKYSGCRYAKGCYLEEFMQLNGYTTSSTKVNQLIEQNGLDAFRIIQQIPEAVCGIPVREYETRFLRDNKIAQRSDWLNYHNNTLYSFGSEEWNTLMMALYGVNSYSQLDECKDRILETMTKHYGGHYFASKTGQECIKETLLSKYGVEYYSQTEEWANKTKNTLLERYGYDNPSKIPEVKAKKETTLQENYGASHPSQIQGFHTKCQNTYKERTGYDWGCDPEQIRKREDTNLEKFGAKYHMMTDKFKEDQSYRKAQYWANQPTEITCPVCNRTMKPGAGYSRFHGSRCRGY